MLPWKEVRSFVTYTCLFVYACDMHRQHALEGACMHFQALADCNRSLCWRLLVSARFLLRVKRSLHCVNESFRFGHGYSVPFA